MFDTIVSYNLIEYTIGDTMQIEQLQSKNIEALRAQRESISRHMSLDADGTFVVLTTAFFGVDRGYYPFSYAVFSLFLELKERYDFLSWSHTFDSEGLVFYFTVDEPAHSLYNTLAHYEDHHPLGASVLFQVYDDGMRLSRADIDAISREDHYFHEPLDALICSESQDEHYRTSSIERIDSYILSLDAKRLMEQLVIYGHVAAYVKSLGFGMYGAASQGNDTRMNFNKFVDYVMKLKQQMSHISLLENRQIKEVIAFENECEMALQQAMLSRQNHMFPIRLLTILLIATWRSERYNDIAKHSAVIGLEHFEQGAIEATEVARYTLCKNGFKDMFGYYVPYMEKSGSTIQTFIYILSRHDDAYVIKTSREESLQKIQFLCKNLVDKPDKWEELNRFAQGLGIVPKDTTNILMITSMMVFVRRHFQSIKETIDASRGGR